MQAQRLADESLDHDPSLQELLDDQLSAADLVIVSKNDLLSDESRQRVEAIVSARIPAAVKTVYINHGEAQLDVLMGVEAAAEDRIEAVHTHHDHHHHHGEHHEHAHDHFDSFVVNIAEVDGDQLVKVLTQLVADNNIYRIKGFAALADKPMRQVVQVVGQRIDNHFDRLWTNDEARRTQLVFIGKDIEASVVTEALQAAVVEAVS